jgi:hypothetical protein
MTPALQIAQLFGVGRTDIDGCKIDMRTAGSQDAREIGGAVVRGLVRAQVQANRNRSAPSYRQTRGDGVHALIVKAKAVDGGPVLGQPVKPRRGIAVLRQGRGGADLDKAETGASKGA